MNACVQLGAKFFQLTLVNDQHSLPLIQNAYNIIIERKGEEVEEREREIKDTV